MICQNCGALVVAIVELPDGSKHGRCPDCLAFAGTGEPTEPAGAAAPDGDGDGDGAGAVTEPTEPTEPA